MNLELLKLRLRFRDLYDRLGASDAEALIAEAFHLELERYERGLEPSAATREKSYGRPAKGPCPEYDDSL